MVQSLREPFALVTRCLSSPPKQSRTRILSANSPTKRLNTTAPANSASKLIAALDALNSNSAVEEIETQDKVPRSGHVTGNGSQEREVGEGKKKLTNQPNTKEPTMTRIHPFFRASTSREVDGALVATADVVHENMASHASGSASSNSPHVAPILYPNPSSVRLSHPSTSTTSSSRAKPPPTMLPRYSYKDYTEQKPVMVFTQVEEEANELVTSLKAGPMALDIEWRVLFRRQFNSTSTQMTERRTAVVQVADTRGVILVIQVYGMNRFPKNLQALLENPDIPKVGVNILNDGRKLFRDYGILAKNLVELGAVAFIADPDPGIGKAKRKIVSLAKLVTKYCGKTLEKGAERTGNWEAELSLKQLEYGANDAHSSLTVYQRLSEIAQERGVVLDDFTAEYTSDVYFNHHKEALDSISRNSSQAMTTVTVNSQRTDASLTHEDQHDVMDPIVSVMRPQYLRAYRYWHGRGMSLEKMCVKLNFKGKPEGLKASTVISYVIGALQADSRLPFEMRKLRELVQMDGTSWIRHREWILSAWSERKNLLDKE